MPVSEQISEATLKRAPTTVETRELDAVRKALNERWDNYREELVNRSAPALVQIERLMEAILAKELGGDHYHYKIAAPTDGDVIKYRQLGYEMLTAPLLGRAWKPGMDISLGLHVDPDGQLRWGGQREHYLVFIRKDVWQKRQAAEEAEREKRFRAEMPDRSDDGTTKTRTQIASETIRTRSRSSVKGK